MQGGECCTFNRDIKPGGLAEYGIYPEKYRLKDGLRAQFRDILGTPNIHYFGNVTIADDQPLTLAELRQMGLPQF
jgi:ferredoxin--NADP+ reductase